MRHRGSTALIQKKWHRFPPVLSCVPRETIRPGGLASPTPLGLRTKLRGTSARRIAHGCPLLPWAGEERRGLAGFPGGLASGEMAEEVGFEPTVELPLRLISSQVPSTAQPLFLKGNGFLGWEGSCVKGKHWGGGEWVKKRRVPVVSGDAPVLGVWG